MVSLLSLSVFCVLSALGCTNPFGIHCPICFPGFSSVGGKRLLPSARVGFDIQLVSQVFPPSAENACSQRQESGLIFR